MNLTDKVFIGLEISTLSTLIAGLYLTYTTINVNAIPPSLYIEIAEKLCDYLRKWDYSKISFEEWVRTCLIIAPKEMFTDEEIEEFEENNGLFIKRKLGNVTLIATANMDVID